MRIYVEHCDHWVLLGYSVLSAVNLWMGWARTNRFVWESDIYTRFLFKKCWSCTSWPWYVSEAVMGLPLSSKSYSHISLCSVSVKVEKVIVCVWPVSNLHGSLRFISSVVQVCLLGKGNLWRTFFQVIWFIEVWIREHLFI